MSKRLATRVIADVCRNQVHSAWLIGDVDRGTTTLTAPIFGKTTLTAAILARQAFKNTIREIQSTAGSSSTANRRDEGKAVTSVDSVVRYETANRRYTQIDFSRFSDFITTIEYRRRPD